MQCMKCRKSFSVLYLFVASFDSIFSVIRGSVCPFSTYCVSLCWHGIRMSLVSLSRQKLSADSLLQDTGKRDKMHSSGKLGPQKKGHTWKFILLSLRHDQTAISSLGHFSLSCRFATFTTLYILMWHYFVIHARKIIIQLVRNEISSNIWFITISVPYKCTVSNC